MYQIAYASEAKDLSVDEINTIIASSQENNDVRGIGGALIYAKGYFLQCIVGDESAIKQTFKRIKNDTRHEHIVVLISEEIDQSLFYNWTMSYVSDSAYTKIIEPIVHTKEFDPYSLSPKSVLQVLKQVSLQI